MGRLDEVKGVLQKAGDEGIGMEALMKETGATKLALYSAVHNLRRKGVAIKFDLNKMRYFYCSEEPGTSAVISPRKTRKKKKHSQTLKVVQPTDPNILEARQVTAADTKGPQAYRALVRKARDLAPEDRSDFFDMLTKSIFYQRCAQAIVDANALVQEIRKDAVDEG